MRSEPSPVIPGLRVIELEAFRDPRGWFVEAFAIGEWRFERDDGTPIEFVEDNVSFNHRGVIRGLHGDHRTWKLLTCVVGECFAVVVDNRSGPRSRRWESYELRAGATQLLIPAGCATGFAALEEPTVMTYKQSERYRGAAEQFTIRWDDPQLGVRWPVEEPIVSARDDGAEV